MCGIFLIYSKKGYLNKKDCLNATEKIKSRGPDKLLKNFYFNRKLYIANSVLSITGKINKKNDKLITSKNKNYDIAFNGQVFNWKKLNKKFGFKHIANDTYTLVNLFESVNFQQVPKKLNGMFAYSILDKKKEKIYIASDPQGEKKLFYFNDSNYFIVSSTISSILKILKDNVQLDLKKLNEYFLTRHFLFDGKTCFKKINLLLPGTNYRFDLKKLKLFSKIYDDPINWISKKELNFNSKLKEKEVQQKIQKNLNDQLKIMIPSVPFGTIFSGGIDSSLQSSILADLKEPKIALALNHVKKDNITKNINKFKKFLKFKLKVINITKNKYISKINKCYGITKFPFLTHDFVGKHQLAEFFRKNNCKVFFAADGADELFGGYEIYKNIKWKTNNVQNYSPYSSYKIKNNYYNKLWFQAYKKYNFIKNKKERMIQASLFVDYFKQSIFVGNIGTDIMCSNSGIEPRNVFIQKNIIKLALNLPLKYKINYYAKNKNFVLKPILKNLFINYFNKNLVYKKQGFSGFPNEAKCLLGKKNQFEMLNKTKINYSKYKKFSNFRSYEWKLINLELFLRNFKNLKMLNRD